MDVERDINNNSAYASFKMQVRLETRDGNVIYTHDADGVHDESNAKDYSETAAEQAAMQDCVQRLFTDPGFIAALSVAHNSD